ncbi:MULTISPECIES: ribosome maturation factor RimM [unclassified Thalassotalea]|uniref:ribosome maturation factor RimM n=1 Tax=unclassified Thalassotalea TaxID=2614972 RepID=UPI0010801330|nr:MULTISPECIES: ribosome maturation factor RimM [unclassified Thalassotalea]NMP17311.1 ribosome maturation factor RimM [Thalassotalea sp. Y01]QBY05229.1 ribosome maturation factor RimM [Thalassotalea sp. HSM 43]
MENNVILGKIGAVYGIKGWLKIHSYTENPEAIFEYSPWVLNLNGKQLNVEISEWRRHNNGLIVKFADISDRNDAQLRTGAEITVTGDVLPELPQGEFYWRDLIGMDVVNESGYNLGKVTDIMETGSNDVLVVKANRTDAFGKKERLIPYLEDQVIKDISLESKQINVDWDPGF